MANKAKQRSAASPSPRRVSAWWIAAAVCLLSAGLYLNTLGHGFLFDDNTLIVQNPTVTQTDWAGILFGGEYRPVRTLSYAVNFALGGLDPYGYHLFNLLLHAGVVGLLFQLVFQLTESVRVAAISALLFAVHPANTAAVAYVSGRKDVLATFFLIAGLSFLMAGRKWAVAGMGCLALAVLSKEVAVVFPVLLLVLAAAAVATRQSEPRSPVAIILAAASRFRVLLVSSAVAAVILAAWTIWLREASRMEGLWGGTWTTNLGTGFKLFVHYLQLAVTGHPLIADYSGRVFPLSSGLLEPATLFSIAVLGGYLALALWLFGRSPWAAAGLLWFLAALLPVLHVIPFHELAADHFLYLPLAGLSIAAAVGLDRLATRRRGVAWALIAILATAAAIRTWQRNPAWADAATLWQVTLRDAPDSFRANQGVALLRYEQGRLEEAITIAERAVELASAQQRPTALASLAQYCHHLGSRHRSQGQLASGETLQQKALATIDEALRHEPDNPFQLNTRGAILREIGVIYQHQGRAEAALTARRQAADAFREALASTQPRVEIQAIWMNMAGIFQDMEDFATARHYLDHFLRAFPDHPGGNFNMGEAFVKTGDYAEAIPFLEKGLQADPGSVEAWDYLAQAYLGSGQPRQAAEALQRALPHVARPSEIHFNLGTIFAGLGEREAATRHFERALALDPNGPLVSRILEKLNEVRSAAASGAG